MATQRESIIFTECGPVKVVKIRVKEGSNFTPGQVILQFDYEGNHSLGNKDANCLATNGPGKNGHVFRANSAGTVEKMFIEEGAVINKGIPILEFTSCSHPTVMKDMCAECGADLRETNERNQTAAVAMVHNIPELMVSMKEAQTLGKADEERLLRDRKLVLLVDLDQTLIHTTNDSIPTNVEDVFHFQLHGPSSPWYHTRLRPYTKEFLRNISSLYELHICTFGSRTYAHMIAGFLDEEGRYFSHRILSRDECFSAHSKTANLKALFPCGDHMVVIIDDREDVWNFAPNLIHVRPYHFFQHTGDINAPPGLAKQEKDDKEGFDFSTLKPEESVQASKKKDEEPAELTTNKDVTESSSAVDVTSQTGLKDKPEEEGAKLELKKDEVQTGDANKEPVSGSEEKNGDIEENPTSTHTSAEPEGGNVDDMQVDSPEKAKGDPEADNEKILTEKTAPKSVEPTPEKSANTLKIHLHDTDDYLLHLQDILRTIHHAYYEMYDDNIKKSEEVKSVPDMKIVLPYVRRKVLEKVNIVFSGVVPTNVPLEKSKPYLVAKSLGAVIMDKVTQATTHVIAARLGTAKLIEAKKYKHIHVVNPDWLWSCAERWERVEERLYPLDADCAVVRRKPPAHCTSPDVAFQLAFAANNKEEQDSTPIYDRLTGKRIFKQVKKEKGKTLATSSGETAQRRFSETVNPLMALSSDDLADMDREVEDIMRDSDDGEDSENDQEPFGEPEKVGDLGILQEDDQEQFEAIGPKGGDLEEEIATRPDDIQEEFAQEEERPGRKRKHEDHPLIQDHHLVIGDVSDRDSPENESLMERFRRGEIIPSLDVDNLDEEEDSNEAEIDELEPDEDVDDSEWCLAGQALEREFLSEED